MHDRKKERKDKLVMNEKDSEYILTGNEFRIVFSKRNGSITSWLFNETELISEALQPNFWRAPTDNDFGNGMEKRCAIWKEVSQQWKVNELLFDRISDSHCSISILFKFPDLDFSLLMKYDFYGSGDVVVNYNFDPGEGDFAEIPRIGMKMKVPSNFSNLGYFGRGPHENYCDRYTSAFVGIYKSSIDDQYFPYVRPQENGYKTDVRWLGLTDHQGIGLFVSGMPLISFSALHYGINDLDQGTKKNYRHTVDLKKQDFVELMIDYKQMGVGGDNSWWARPHEQYQIPAQEYSYSFRMKPLSWLDDPREIAKEKPE